MVQILPQVKVFQEFTLVPTPIVEPLRAFIVGPHYNSRLYASSKSTIGVGSYDPDQDVVEAWPAREAGEVVDQASAEVTIEDALVRYYTQNSGGIGYDPVSPNIVQLAGTYGWAAVTGYPALPTLVKDVEVGDYVRLTDPDNLSQTLLSTVRGLSREALASSHPSNATVVSGNKATSSATSTAVSAPGGSPYSVALGTGAYKPYKVGLTADRYTFTVTTAGASGVAKFSVTTASGQDVATDVTLTAGSPLAVGDYGLTITFTGSGSVSYGDRWVFDTTCAFTAPVGGNFTVAGTYSGPEDTIYVLEVVTGGVVGTDSPTFKVSTSTGLESAGPFSATTSAQAISAFGASPITVAFSNGITLCSGDRFSVAATAASEGRVDRLELADTIPTALANLSDVNLEVLSKKTFKVLAKRYASPSVPNYVTGDASITLKSGITYYEAGSVLNGMPVRAGTVYLGYRAISQSWVGEVQTISDVSSLTTYFADLTPANPLAFGVKKALENANGTDVKFIAVASDDVAGYTAALSKTLEREDVYSVVPMSSQADIKALVAGHVTSQSSPEKGRWRIAWVANAPQTEKQLVGQTSVTATISQYAGDAVGVYRLVTAAAGLFWTNAVTTGDAVRYAYGVDALGEATYATGIVDRVISETQLLLLTGPVAAVPIASKIEVWRTLSTDQQVSELVAANSYGNRRVFSVFTGGATLDGYASQPDYFVAAAAAGLRSGVAPHQGLTNVALAGIGATPFTTKTLTGTQLDTLASAGYWLVRQDARSGSIYTRKQLSTDLTDLNTQEQSITTNLDSLSYYFKLSLSPYIGRTNNVDAVRSLIKADLNAAFEFFFSAATPTLGSQLLDGTQILELRPHAVLADTLVIRVQCVIPAPLNTIQLYLVV